MIRREVSLLSAKILFTELDQNALVASCVTIILYKQRFSCNSIWTNSNYNKVIKVIKETCKQEKNKIILRKRTTICKDEQTKNCHETNVN